jgi:tetratricopeptide (TPR) repeat protein
MRDAPASTSRATAGVTSAPPASFLSVEPSLGGVAPTMRGQKLSRVIEPEMRAAQAAQQAGRWQDVLDDAQAAERKQGITVFDTKTINHFKGYAHLQLHENSAALTDFERVLAAGVATPEETAAIAKTVSALQTRAESDRNALAQREADSAQQEAEPRLATESPQRETESDESLGAGTDVGVGQLYYAGDYRKAVDAISRGIKKGSILHLDEAYVYLGLAQQKLGNIAEARRAFARLKDVPNVSPRIVRLWGLYADTLAGQAQTADSLPASRQLEQAGLRPLQPDARK